MRVRMITTMAGPEVSALAGQEVELDNETAVPLIKGGYAQPVKAAIETAAIKQPEKAAARPGRSRRAKK